MSMSELGILIPIAAVTIGPVAWVANTWVRARHGYPLEEPEGSDEVGAKRQVELLTNENERQAGQITRLEARLAVLERIATDPAERTAREIDALR
ncbi:hypothetical protein [Sphingomonas bacterium]|uniref:hypothetical protein n=1 Tax=Sphingomonas bacterium TaxID=1895847 RepID=UPI00261E4B8F|nr:hypothetical protein [Sphingomonas bacterium]MDB5678068.1 hypothetical protein [Sphingomonas bacterium]